MAKSRLRDIAQQSDLDTSPTRPGEELAARLAALGQAELEELKTFLDGISGFERGGLLIEACHCLDHASDPSTGPKIPTGLTLEQVHEDA